MTWEDRVKGFKADLREISERWQISVDSCGCCSSISLRDLKDPTQVPCADGVGWENGPAMPGDYTPGERSIRWVSDLEKQREDWE